MRLGAGAGQRIHIPMKTVLLVLLAASLAANIVLGLRSARPSSRASSALSGDATSIPAVAVTGGTATEATTRASSQPGGGTGNAATGRSRETVPHVWRPVSSDDDLHRTVADLRAAGYPAGVVRAVVNQLLNERFAGRQPNAGQPFWKQGAPTPEMVAAQNALNQERQTLFDSLLGPDARPSAMLDEVTRRRRYGNLSDEKIDAIARIERDYGEMTAETWARRRGNSASGIETAMQTQRLMEEEKLADLAAVLTPEEIAQYEQRSSPSARTLSNSLRNVEISEAEYAQIYAAQKAFDATNPMRTTMDAITYSQRQAEQLALNEQVRAVLGENRFYAYLEGADMNFANVVRSLAQFPAVTKDASYQVYRLQIELQSLMAQTSRGGPPSQEKIAEMRTTVETYNGRLDSILGPEAAEAYRSQGSGRMFSSFRNAPRPAPSTQVQPVGR